MSQTRPFILSHICKCLARGRVPLGGAGEGRGRDGGGRGGRSGKWAHPVGGGKGHREGRRKRSQALPEEEAVPGFSPGVAPGIKGATGQPPPGQPPGTHSGAGSPEPSPCCDGKTLLSPHPHLHGATWPQRAGGSLTPRLRMWGVQETHQISGSKGARILDARFAGELGLRGWPLWTSCSLSCRGRLHLPHPILPPGAEPAGGSGGSRP